MKKKGDMDIGQAIEFLAVFFVILVSAYLVYNFTLAKSAPSNRFTDFVAQNFGYKDEYQSLDAIQSAINDVVTTCPGDPAIIGKIDDEISKLEARQSGSLQDYMLRKFREMKERAQSSLKYCEAIDAYNGVANFTGKDAKPFEDSLAPIKQKFVDVGENNNFQSVILAKEKISLLDKMIKDCKDIKQGQCTADNTKKFCVWTGSTGVLSNPCIPAVCAGAKEDLCRGIFKNNKFCYPTYDFSLKFISCKSCADTKTCADYGYSSDACGQNICKLPDCEWHVPTAAETGGVVMTAICRKKGETTLNCENFNGNRAQCEKVLGCVYLTKGVDGKDDVCLSCQNPLVECKNVYSPTGTMLGYTFDEFKKDCITAVGNTCGKNCDIKVRLDGLDTESGKCFGDKREKCYYGEFGDSRLTTVTAVERNTCCGQNGCSISPALLP